MKYDLKIKLFQHCGFNHVFFFKYLSSFFNTLGEFPELSRVFVTERDLFLANTLRETVDARIHFSQGLFIFFNYQFSIHVYGDISTGHFVIPNSADGPPVVVGVVGIGHVAGIVEVALNAFE